jgi:CHAD domain-containing protein
MKAAQASTLIHYLEDQRAAFAEQAEDAFQKPTKQNIHDLRVTVRRIRAVLWLLERSSPNRHFPKLSSSLCKFARVLGELRELDVAIKDAHDYQIADSDLKSKRINGQDRVSRRIDLPHRKKVLRRLDKAIEDLHLRPNLNLHPGICALQQRLSPWRGKKNLESQEFHRLRIATKKARYALEAIGKPVEPLRRLQDLLGRGHDLQVLQELSEKNPFVQADMISRYQEASPLIQSTLEFAVKQLKAADSH